MSLFQFHLHPSMHISAAQSPRPKTALIDPGGGMKGVFSAGVTDAFIDAGITFDLYLGVSAGSANLASYAAGQKGRTHAFYLDYAMRPEYMSARNFLKSRSYFDFDYIFSTLTDTGGEYPLDYAAYQKQPGDFVFVSTNAISGRSIYFGKDSIHENAYDVFKASCSIPWLCTPRTIRGIPAADGTLSDPLPVEKALQMGAEKIVVILPSPAGDKADLPASPAARLGSRISSHMDAWSYSLLRHSKRTAWLPGLAAAMEKRPELYRRSLEKMEQLQKEGKLMIIRPENTCGVFPLCRDPHRLEKLYQEGLRQGAKAAAVLSAAQSETENEE